MKRRSSCKKVVALMMTVVMIVMSVDVSSIFAYGAQRQRRVTQEVESEDTGEVSGDETNDEIDGESEETANGEASSSEDSNSDVTGGEASDVQDMERPNGFVDSGYVAPSVSEYEGSADGMEILKAFNIPSSYSAVEKGHVTSVKDQASWGICWAFAATAAMESYALSHNLVASPDDVDFSEYALAYLTFQDTMYMEETGDYTSTTASNHGFDSGANYEMAFKALSKWAGIYNDDGVSYSNSLEKKEFNTVFNSEDIDFVFTGQQYINMNDTDEVKTAIIENGAVAVSYYSSTKYSNDNHKYYYNYERKMTNHGVAIVGWDDSIDKQLFTVTDTSGVSHTPNNNGAWLIKNSWGTDSGDNGYFWMSYEDVSVNYYGSATVYQIAPKKLYDNIYQHDGATPFLYSISSNKYAVVYDIKGESKQKLQAVSFAIDDIYRKYTINVYKNTDEAILENGELVSTVSGTTTFAGYYTATLPEAIECREGDSFSIIITFDNDTKMIVGYNGYSYNNGSTCMTCTSEEGQAYYCLKGEFIDMRQYIANGYKYVDLCIKAFTTDVNDEPEIPQISELKYTDKGQATIVWQKIDGAVSYELWKSTSIEGTDAKVITGIVDNTYIDVSDANSISEVDKVKAGERYYYKIRAVLEDGVTEYSQVKYLDVKPSRVQLIYVATLSDNSAVNVIWSAPDKPYDGYKVYRAKGDSNYELIATLPAEETNYLDEDIKYSVVNSYYVVTYINEGNIDVESWKSECVEGRKYIDSPSSVNVYNSDYGIVSIQWSMFLSTRCDGYNIYMKDVSGEYVLIASVDKDTTKYIHNMSDFVEGNTYIFQVKSYITEDGTVYENYGKSSSVQMLKKPINEDFRWYVKDTGTSTVTMLKVYNPIYNKYTISHQSGGMSYYTVSGSVGEWKYSNCPVGEIRTLSYKGDGNYTNLYSNLTIGGLYKAPVLQPIEDTSVSSTESGVKLQTVITNEMENFDYRYQWYVSDTPDGEATAIEGATESSYYAEVEPFAKKYYYCIITCEYGEIMTYSTVNGSGGRTKVTGVSEISTPKLYDIEYTEGDQVSITWESIPHATGYELLRSVNNSDEYVIVASGLTETGYTDSIECNKVYNYKVRAVYNDIYSEYSDTKEIYLPLPQVEIQRDSDETIVKLLWSAKDNIDGYRVYRSDGINAELLATLVATQTEYTDTTVKSLITYSYYVCTYVDSEHFDKESEKSNVVTAYFDAPAINDFWVDNFFCGSHYMFWSMDNCDMIDGYNIYAGSSKDNLSKVATVDKYLNKFEYNVDDYEDGITVFYGIKPYVINNGIEIEGDISTDRGEVNNTVLDADITWFVKKNSFGMDVIAIKIIEDTCSDYTIFCDTDYTDNEMFFDNYFLTLEEARAGCELEARYYSQNRIDYVCINDGNWTYACQNPPIAVGGPFISPILKPIENVRVNSAEDSVVLEAVVTNPMENFDYRYQWYVSDSATGDATAIDGATERTYTVSCADNEVKYYYCSVICEYVDITTVNTTNVSGGRTMVSGNKSSLAVILPDDMEGYSIVSDDDKVAFSGEDYAFTVSVAKGYTTTENFAVKANGVVIEADVNGVYTISNITEDVAITVEGVEYITDTASPTITGVVNGGVYHENVTFTVSDEYLASVAVDGEVVELENGSYTIVVDNKEHTVIAEDVAGNKTTINIGMYELYTVTFIADGKVVAKKEVSYGQSLADIDIPTVPTKTGYDKTAPYWDKTDFSNITVDISVNAVYTINTYKVTLMEGIGYTYTKNSTVVNYKDSFSFSISVKDAYVCDKNFAVKANGTVLEPDESGVYTITDVAEDITITVEGVVDITAPIIIGITDGWTYYGETTFVVSDKCLSKVTVDGEVVELNNGAYVLEADNKEHTIVAVDESGNKTEVIIGVYKVYTVTYKVDGILRAQRKLNHGQTVSNVPTIPTKTGYDKTAPYWDVTDFSNVTGDIVVNAVYTINTYTVSLNKGQGYSFSQDSDVVEHGDDFSFTISIDEGYILTEDFAVKANGVVLTANANGVYTVIDIQEDITITVEGVEGLVDDVPPTITGVEDGGVYYGEVTFTVTDDELTQVTVDGEVVELSNGTYTIEADNKQHTIVAEDESGNRTEVTIGVYKVYTVTFKADGKEVAKREVNYGQTLASSDIPSVPAKTGYDQIEPYWDVTDFSNITDNKTVNAVYTINRYTVTLSAGDGYSYSESIAVTELEYGERFTFSVSVRDGYTKTADFAVKANGVALTADASGVYTVANIAENIVITVEGVEEVKDTTAPVITGVENDGVYYGEVTFAVTDEELSQVTVDGIIVELINDTYTIVADNKQHTIVAEDESGNKTEVTIGVYKVYTVTFMADGKEVARREVNYGQALASSDIPKIPAKTGYDQTEPYWDVTDFSNITDNKTVNVVYTINRYTVTLSAGNGYSYAKNTEKTELEYGESFTFTVLVEEGYTKTADFAVKANGVALTADASGVYTVANIAENIVITVEGVEEVKDTTAPVITGVENDGVYYGKVTFTVNDDELSRVTVDGSVVELTNDTYTILADNKQHTIVAEDKSGNRTEITIGVYKVYTVTFVAHGKEVARREVNYGQALASSDIPVVPVKTGYDQTEPYWDVTDFSNVTADMVVNAVYTINTYTVTLNGGNGYTFSMNTSTVYHGDNFTFTVFIEDNYTATENFAVKANGIVLETDASKLYKLVNITEHIRITVEGVEIIQDVTAPTITGAVNGGTYYGKVTFTVNDDELSRVTVDGSVVELTNDTYTILADNKQHTIVAEDESGNRTEVTIGVYKVYTVTFMADGKEVARREVNYGQELASSDIPEVPAKIGYDQTKPYWNVTDFSNITDNKTVNAVYIINTYTVTLTSGDGYRYSKNVVATVLEYQESFTFTVTVEEDYTQTESFAVKANGVALTSDASGVYTIANISEDTVITVEGVEEVKDTTAPIITGLMDSTVYYTTQVFGVVEENAVVVRVNGTIAADYVLTGNVNTEYVIEATDEAGNSTVITVTMKTIASITEEISTVTEGNVKLTDRDAITSVKQMVEKVDIASATVEEKAQLNAIINKCDSLTKTIGEIIKHVDSFIEVIKDLPEAEQTETDSEEAVAALAEAKAAYETLTDYEKSLIADEYKKRIEALEDKLSDYKFIEGVDSSYSKNSNTPLVFKVNGAYSKFKAIKVDDKELDVNSYMAMAGSTIITVSAEYLDGLEVGEHTLIVIYEDGEVSETFSIEKAIDDVSYRYGDVNSDGEIDISDGVIIKKYLAGISVDINKDASDVNADGTINVSDAVILLKYLAGMDIVLGQG